MKRTLFPNCRNPLCEYHKNAPLRWYYRKGTFTLKWNKQPVPRYQCKVCKRNFSSHTYRAHYKQKKPYVNEGIRSLLCKQVTINDIARHYQVSVGLVLRRLASLGIQSKKTAQKAWQTEAAKTSYVQFDEIRTCHRTICQPLTIAFAIRPKDGHIITAHVGEAPVQGAGDFSKLSTLKYGKRANRQEQVVRGMLRDIRKVVRDKANFTIATDKDSHYHSWIVAELPFAKHEAFDGGDLKVRERSLRLMDLNDDLPTNYSNLDQPKKWWTKRAKKNGKNQIRAFDPLFHINQKCALLRGRMSRMRKHTWGFTQKVENLEHHLWIFIALHNGYKLPK